MAATAPLGIAWSEPGCSHRKGHPCPEPSGRNVTLLFRGLPSWTARPRSRKISHQSRAPWGWHASNLRDRSGLHRP
ncbi:hypothetical protein ACFPRL_14835 [Pseudoclavibacter helvolus]